MPQSQVGHATTPSSHATTLNQSRHNLKSVTAPAKKMLLKVAVKYVHLAVSFEIKYTPPILLQVIYVGE